MSTRETSSARVSEQEDTSSRPLAETNVDPGVHPRPEAKKQATGSTEHVAQIVRVRISHPV